MTDSSTPLRVYWQPGCSSCLRARELLQAHGIAFVSVNVREDPDATRELAALGARSVPVVARGRDYVLAQDIDELARFAGIATERSRLTPDELAARLQALLALGESCLATMPADRLHERLPQRERTWLDLGFHVAMVVQGLLSAGTGGELAYEAYERRAPAGWRDAAPAIEFSRATRRALATWWESAREAPGRDVQTYYGTQPLAALMERTAWHVAQHCRQLEYLLREVAGIAGAPVIPAAVLRGLPLPAAVWDPEVLPS